MLVYHRHCGKGDVTFFICRMTSRDHAITRVIYLCGWWPLIINHYPGDHVIKDSCDLLCSSHLLQAIILPKFCGSEPLGSSEYRFFICHVTIRDHVNKRSCDFVGENSSPIIITLPSLVVTSFLEVEINLFQYLNHHFKFNSTHMVRKMKSLQWIYFNMPDGKNKWTK